ncbi:MAG TPA: RHS repeat-associated core domain-containing protein [Pseudomonas sp.]|uniref:RHS repeat domain-containing protein n=1 Tax=Pseudomonas sp. TaxID=306 RepID=UPI002EDBB05D
MSLHTQTPQLHVIDPRALLVRHVAYCRAQEGAVAEERITGHTWDEAGRHVADHDPRLWNIASLSNTTTIHSLRSASLRQENVDAGWRLTLRSADGQSLDSWDGRGSFSHLDYDELLRPVALTEKLADSQQPVIVERFMYGDSSAASALHNQCGRLIRHDDPAGTSQGHEFGLAGGVLVANRRFLLSVELPDWPQDVTQREQLLQSGEGYTSSTAVDATASVIEQTDSRGNRRTPLYGVSGQLKETSVQLAGASSALTLISEITYNASGQVEIERFGNGVIRKSFYDAASERLTRILANKPDGTPLQDLNYHYDPVGNIVDLEDASLPTCFAANQKIEPINRYGYDSLYQLIQASGWEVSIGPSHGPALPDLQTPIPDPNKLSNYTQTYSYDAGANMLQMRHVGAQSFTRTMKVATDSNRSLPDDDTSVDLTTGFDANGNLQEWVRGQTMQWDLRNQLSLVTTVQREAGANDDEVYIYDGGGQRCRKISSVQTGERTLVSEVSYLPGLEIRSQPDGEILEVVTIQAGRDSMRILHWSANKPEGIDNDQVRYDLGDHLGSSTLELDDQGGVITQEGYYPFGGTAWWTARSAVEAKYKTIRYSGKERDATGLYYYGFRYYAPWLQRWINPDPQGTADGLNVYCFVGNTPINRIDANGLIGMGPQEAAMARWVVSKWRAPIKVKRLTDSIVSVSIKGHKSVFESVGINLDRATKVPRELTYLALDNRLQGKVSGGDALIKLGAASGAEVESVSGSMPAAYINGGYFNMGRKKPNETIAEHASVGENLIDNRQKPFVLPPDDYAAKYSKITLSDGSYIHVAPKLSMRGIPQFSRKDSLLEKNIYGEETSHVGALGHASDPNARSGISLAENDTAKTRLAVVLNPGRGTFSKNTDEPGFTMLEWTIVMTRLDNLNPKDEEGFPAASSWNLDGGDSSVLGVLDETGKHLLRVNTLKLGRGVKPARPIGNFLSFH